MTQAVSGYVENRRYRRYAVGLPCTVRPKGKAAGPHPDLQTKTIDVSRGGLLFSAQTGFEVGATIECLLELPIHSIRNHIVTIRCLGRVVRVGALDGGTVGVGATIDTFEFVNPV
ncbi:MAG TPA: PilZ domain-containing protein [Terriglobia bacterium]|nr:PilZ domain-containing protein [Terriglobia bacterium]